MREVKRTRIKKTEEIANLLRQKSRRRREGLWINYMYLGVIQCVFQNKI